MGHVFAEVSEDCPCGCHSRLVAATKIAAEMRSKIFKELKLTSSAGIAHNKLLAKLAGTLNKPNDQTLVYPCTASMVMSSLGSASKIFGVGQKTYELLEKNDISTVDDLRSTPLDVLEAKIGKDLARKLKDSAEGIDETIVKPSGKPQTIGLEEGLKSVSLVSDVESRLGALLRRLTEMTNEDGRIPLAVKVRVIHFILILLEINKLYNFINTTGDSEKTRVQKGELGQTGDPTVRTTKAPVAHVEGRLRPCQTLSFSDEAVPSSSRHHETISLDFTWCGLYKVRGEVLG